MARSSPTLQAIHHLSEEIDEDLQYAENDIRHGQLQRSMALISGFAAIVSGFEAYTQHQRGHFSNQLMWTPVWLTPLMIAASGAALFSQKAAKKVLPWISLGSLVDGVIGFIFHLRGIKRLPGGLKIGRYNIVMGPPVFAPLLMSSVGLLGLLASLFRREPLGKTVRVAPVRRAVRSTQRMPLTRKIAYGRFQQGMALITASLAVLAGGEAYVEHLRGSYSQRVMWTPVWVTPPMFAAAVGSMRSGRVAHRVLPFAALVTFLDGLLGFFLHLRGVKRMPGGFTNIGFNITMGPPLFAPLLFTAVGLLGLIASLLRRE